MPAAALEGTRTTIDGKGFGTNLQILAGASAEDFMEALNTAKPGDCTGSAIVASTWRT